MFDRPDSGERAILVHPEMAEESHREDPDEFRELARAAGVEPLLLMHCSGKRPNAKTLIGSGKIEEIRAEVEAHGAQVVLVNHPLSPSQERNLERELKVRVLDRIGLILDIFAQRARTHEGKLQVELAQLEHLSTRLVRGWTHLERQKGGIGLRGPGETQLETDRRLLRARIQAIHRRLDRVRSQRDQNRRARQRADLPTISLVGYTNAGKSSLFNALTESTVYAADQLFATLDPTLRRLEVEEVGQVVLADTVGFIRHLPHRLVKAFRATLEETAQASLLLHVVDAGDPRRLENIEAVDEVLTEIGAGELPVVQVMNKIDLVPGLAPNVDRDENGCPVRVWVSALTGDGLDALRGVIRERIGSDIVEHDLAVGPQLGRLRARLYEARAVVTEQQSEDGGAIIRIRMPRQDWLQIVSREGLDPRIVLAGGSTERDGDACPDAGVSID